jgi:hypothetical protein
VIRISRRADQLKVCLEAPTPLSRKIDQQLTVSPPLHLSHIQAWLDRKYRR